MGLEMGRKCLNKAVRGLTLSHAAQEETSRLHGRVHRRNHGVAFPPRKRAVNEELRMEGSFCSAEAFLKASGRSWKGQRQKGSSGKEAQSKEGNSFICSFCLRRGDWGPNLDQKYRNEQDEQVSSSHGAYLFAGRKQTINK